MAVVVFVVLLLAWFLVACGIVSWMYYRAPAHNDGSQADG